MEESELYEGLEQLRLEEAEADKESSETKGAKDFEDVFVAGEDKAKDVYHYLPKRSGKIKYKIYGLDLSGPKWADVCNKMHEEDELPEEPKPIPGLSFQEDEDPSPLIAERIELLQPSKTDGVALLNKLIE